MDNTIIKACNHWSMSILKNALTVCLMLMVELSTGKYIQFLLTADFAGCILQQTYTVQLKHMHAIPSCCHASNLQKLVS
jgi:hypothetical protein